MLTDDAKEELKSCKTYEEFLALAKKTGGVRKGCFCELHHERCDLLKAVLNISGIICVSWSPMGAQKGTAGLDFMLFVAWVCCRRALQEQLLLYISLTIRQKKQRHDFVLLSRDRYNVNTNSTAQGCSESFQNEKYSRARGVLEDTICRQ